MFQLFQISTKLLLIFSTVILLFSNPVVGAPKKQVILLLADYITLTDLTIPETNFLKELGEKGTMGLMNTNTALNRMAPHTHASISAGRPSFGVNSNIIAGEANEIVENEPAGTSFRRYTGINLRAGEIGIINWPQIIENNQGKNRTDISPGFLGNSLKEVGLVTAVFGNSDLPRLINRPASLITADFNGITSFGTVGEELLRPSQSFLSWHTDYEKLTEKTLDALLFADFLVIDVGDLNRLENLSKNGLENVLKKERKLILQNINDFTRKVFNSINLDNTLFIIASSTPAPSVLGGGNYLVPIILHSKVIEPGLVYSNTTRREGCITNTDLTATILNFLEIDISNKIKQLTGQPILGIQNTYQPKLNFLIEFNQKLIFIYQTRPLIIKPYVVLQIITILLAVPLFFTLKKLIPYYIYWLSFLVAYPLALLVIEIFQIKNFILFTVLTVILGMFFVAVSYFFTGGSFAKLFVILGIFTTLAIVYDIITGSNLMKQSVLGYDTIAGARYYGIGNEYIGVLIGSSFLGVGSSIRKKNNKFFFALEALYFVFIIWLVFASDYGTNFGGTMALITAFIYWVWRWQKESLNPSKNLLIFLFIIFILLILISGLLFAFEQSHIGRAFILIKQEGSAELFNIIVRKAQMNFKLIRYTNWSRVFLLGLLSMIILFFKPRGFIQSLYQKQRPLYESFSAILVGSIGALVWNDSGIVAASTAMIYATYPLLSLALKEKWQVQ